MPEHAVYQPINPTMSDVVADPRVLAHVEQHLRATSNFSFNADAFDIYRRFVEAPKFTVWVTPTRRSGCKTSLALYAACALMQDDGNDVVVCSIGKRSGERMCALILAFIPEHLRTPDVIARLRSASYTCKFSNSANTRLICLAHVENLTDFASVRIAGTGSLTIQNEAQYNSFHVMSDDWKW